MLLLSDLDLRLARSFSLDKNEHRDFLLNYKIRRFLVISWNGSYENKIL